MYIYRNARCTAATWEYCVSKIPLGTPRDPFDRRRNGGYYKAAAEWSGGQHTAVATGERGRSKKGVRGNPHTFLHVQCVHSTRAENPMRKHDTTNNILLFFIYTRRLLLFL